MRFVKILILVLGLPISLTAALTVGIGKQEIIPPIGTPSAGYVERQGAKMEGIHDPLMATALYLDNGEKRIVLCSVDHLGFTEEMVQEIISKVCIEGFEVYIASTHTHSGGGGFMDTPLIGEALAGKYDPAIKAFYIQRTIDAINEAYANKQPAKLGIGYGESEDISKYRSTWPEDVTPIRTLTIFKIEKEDGSPLAVLVNYPMHPTVLSSENRLFSADFVGSLRSYLEQILGDGVAILYFNGAQGDIIPAVKDRTFEASAMIGSSLSKSVKEIWDRTQVSENLSIRTKKEAYSLIPKATPFGLQLPIPFYQTEMNALIFNETHAFITIPGELSCVYDKELKEEGNRLGYSQVSIFGLLNGAHGYIIKPEAWRQKTYESKLSFGGENYGEEVKIRAIDLLQK